MRSGLGRCGFLQLRRHMLYVENILKSPKWEFSNPADSVEPHFPGRLSGLLFWSWTFPGYLSAPTTLLFLFLSLCLLWPCGHGIIAQTMKHIKYSDHIIIAICQSESSRLPSLHDLTSSFDSAPQVTCTVLACFLFGVIMHLLKKQVWWKVSDLSAAAVRYHVSSYCKVRGYNQTHSLEEACVKCWASAAEGRRESECQRVRSIGFQNKLAFQSQPHAAL